eukprot:Pgem_evm1s7697
MMHLLTCINNLDDIQKECIGLLKKATPLHESFFQRVLDKKSEVWKVFCHLQVTKRIYDGDPDNTIDNSVVDINTNDSNYDENDAMNDDDKNDKEEKRKR